MSHQKPEYRIPVHERFHSFQGEGVYMGRSAFFIRTFGCPVHCPWCDSAGTWHKDWVPKHVDRPTVETLAQEAADAKPDFVVITGGEPTIQPNLPILVEHLQDQGLRVHLETCGAFPFDTDIFNWITVSPKREAPPFNWALLSASEVKIIVDSEDAIEYWVNTLDVEFEVPVWLHPEWSRREDQKILSKITQWVKSQGAPYRAGWQLHKLYRADFFDGRTREEVPLGGKV